MRELTAETLLPLCDVAARYPARGGRKKDVAVVRRWVRKGVLGVRLEAVRLADGLWRTSEEALARFHRAVAEARARRPAAGCVARPLPRRSLDAATEAAKRYLRRRPAPAPRD